MNRTEKGSKAHFVYTDVYITVRCTSDYSYDYFSANSEQPSLIRVPVGLAHKIERHIRRVFVSQLWGISLHFRPPTQKIAPIAIYRLLRNIMLPEFERSVRHFFSKVVILQQDIHGIRQFLPVRSRNHNHILIRRAHCRVYEMVEVLNVFHFMSYYH